MTRFTLALAALWLASGPLPLLAETPKIDRSIGREPVYQSKTPKYGLLVFGPSAEARVWLVLDGDTLYVDRNGNGDLTEPGKRVAAEKPGHVREEDGYSFDVGDLSVGGRTHKGLRVFSVPLRLYTDLALGKRPDVRAALAKEPKAAAVFLSLDVDVPGMRGGGLGGRVSFEAGPVDLAGVFQFAGSPSLAPVVRLGGPLQVTFYAELPALRVGRGGELVLVVGCPGVGPGTFASLSYEGAVPQHAKPVAELSFPAAKPGDAPVVDRIEITGRC